MTLTTGFTDNTPGGSAESPKTGDLSAAITSGSTNATIRITNSHADDITTMWYRDTGTTTYFPIQLMPGLTQDVGLSLPSSNARTFEYYFVGGALQVDVVAAWGTGYSTASVTVAQIREWLGNVYSTDDISDAVIQAYINKITNDVNKAASRHLKLAMYALEDSDKTDAVKEGTCWKVLMEIHNKGMSRGLEAQSPRVSLQTAKDFQDSYNLMIARMNSGIYY